MHGGKGGRPIKHGLYSSRLSNVRADIATRIEAYHSDPALLSLRGELATQKALLEAFLEDREHISIVTKDGEVVDIQNANYEVDANALAESISRTVERITRILRVNAITASELVYYTEALAEVIREFVPEDRRSDCAGKLRQLGRAISNRRTLDGFEDVEAVSDARALGTNGEWGL